MTKYIHIHAKNDLFEIWEQVTEKKAVPRLRQIKKLHIENYHRRAGDLVVKTRLINPTLF